VKVKIASIQRVDPAWLNREIGRRLRAERERQELTLQQVGDGLGVSRACVNNWELGKHQANFVVTQIYNLALFYRVPVGRLLP
jgi:transcriptional regulator with XRE-family HTH domain